MRGYFILPTTESLALPYFLYRRAPYLALSLANSIAVAYFPMPVEAPVTSATLPSSFPGISCLLSGSIGRVLRALSLSLPGLDTILFCFSFTKVGGAAAGVVVEVQDGSSGFDKGSPPESCGARARLCLGSGRGVECAYGRARRYNHSSMFSSADHGRHKLENSLG